MNERKARWPRLAKLREFAASRRDPIIVVPYLGYGTTSAVRLSGRVLQDEGFRPTSDTERHWRNFVAFMKRLESDEVPGARVRAAFQGHSLETASDREGYFHFELPGTDLAGGWHDVELELPDLAVTGKGSVLVPSPDAEFGVISDIDDTVVQSGVMRKLRMVVDLATSNAYTRKPFEGVAAFYRALHRGRNPFFYVSNSPHNLYLPLVEFLQHQEIPAGPLLLRDFGRRMKKNHKASAIEEILGTYPALPFILIGDSGEHDPEIYTDVLRRFPERVRVIYIRSIDRSPERLAAIDKLIRQVATTKCQLVLAPDSEFAAAHAAAEGLLPATELPKVRTEKLADQA